MSAPIIDSLPLPPHSLEAEHALLGALLANPESFHLIEPPLEPSDFYNYANRLIYQAIFSLASQGKPADVLTVSDLLREIGNEKETGGLEYLNRLTESYASAANLSEYARIVKDKALKRNLISKLAQLEAEVNSDRGASSEDLLDRVQSEFLKMGLGKNKDASSFESSGSILDGVIDEMRSIADSPTEIRGCESGIEQLDDVTRGFRPGQLVVIAARPGIGKTAFAFDQDRQNAGYAEENCWYTTAELINSGLASYGVSLNGDNTPLFQFGERPAVDPADRSGMNLTITFSPDDIDCLNYDTGTGLYALSNGDGSPVQDADNGQQVGFTNVFVFYASSGIKDDGYTRQYDMTAGTGLYLHGGAWERINWTKEDATGPFAITNEAGETLVVSPGKSFIAIWGGYYGQGISLTAADGSAQTLPDKPALLESGISDEAAAAAEADYNAAQEAASAETELARAQAELPDAQAALEEAQAALDADPENEELLTARDNAQANVDALNAIVDAAAQDGEQAE